MRYDSLGSRLFGWANIAFMVLFACASIYPYINTFAVALNDGTDTMLGGITVYPRQFTLANFHSLLADDSIIRALALSVVRVVVGTALALLVQFTAAYVFANRGLYGRTTLLVYFMIPMFFGGGLIPTYLLYSKLHLLNNFLVYVLPGAFAFFNMIIIRTYLYTIPDSLVESAKMDGAGEFRILSRIILPLSMPIVATIALWTAVNNWNDWTTTLTFVTDQSLFTLQYKLMQIIKESDMAASLIQEALQRGDTTAQSRVRITPDSIRSAQVILTTLPIILVYPFLQKYFIKGALIGSVKE
ncbi:carbohydrate ABC transporter permease [Paenibacillus lycopersici]|uniref:Carbohydrate ABC transporter permease n=1 Tax=Paenibacillus lycopersici TaxID=2704462 RepID=A0A6C0FR41_9BACL|nr:carbohydrate ABC transporter permease [Paenibacillus lycopersici]QHT59598.1 carbohydrate ABC transporter permease [Paenibacillus lycopersici]